MEKKLEAYVLFPSHSDGLALEKVLKSNNVKYTIVPTPRKLSKCCGISIRIEPGDIPKVQSFLNNNPSINIEGIHTLEKRKSFLFNF
ncbi:DUF3343 domain-containing protein [Paramaledivibacter caminithermalis]|jgi:hypothetical protein|uniref:Putative Se/S carrier protein-like domain-containing protein n=1 Tax=Paramaledivibacter caminithermalis (strain DSM 15212 / CIP 107654 / DViRD3) TaxID=1121301 RepID=A0A1M6T1S5_PARC5|nr:DUF3343 domain-containing protein [Paramaledivibacter caminithermalis]SHK50856.1 Protein of unknown function [Paramaledivibacter caminithermalis DSM 15212]